MCELSSDIARCPEVVPWVIWLRIRSDSETEAVADMSVGCKGLGESFACRGEKQQPHDVAVHDIDGPMRHLDNEWHFTPIEGGGCRVDFLVDFSFRNRLFETLAGQMFDKALRRMIAAFEERAADLLGLRRKPTRR